jgi:hypothetical protein
MKISCLLWWMAVTNRSSFLSMRLEREVSEASRFASFVLQIKTVTSADIAVGTQPLRGHRALRASLTNSELVSFPR